MSDYTEAQIRTNNNTKVQNSQPPTSEDQNNIISLASKQISDVIQIQGPSTSTNYSFKTEIRINILEEPKSSQKSIDTNDSSTLSLFKNNSKKETVDVEDSYVTMDACMKEKTTATNEVVMFSRNERTQRQILTNSEAPPPYDSNPPPPYSSSRNRGNPRNSRERTAGNPGENYPVRPLGYEESSFMEICIRHKFVQKVFFILAVQLLISTSTILLAMFHEPSKIFVATNMPMFYIMAALQLVLYIALVCYQSTRRIFPLNFILLLLFTISMSYLCAAATVFFSTKVVLITMGSTGLVCLLLTLLAFQTWFDITKWGFIIAIASIIFIVFSIVVVIVSIFIQSRVLWLVYSGIAVLLFSVYLMYDMQCILGGRRQELSPEEYIYGALTLYVDIIMIFMYMLPLVNAASN